MANEMAHPIPHRIPRGFRNREEKRREKGEGRGESSAFHPSQPMNPENVLANQQRLRDLENATVADAELMHNCRWKWIAARQRMANRRAEIVRLRDVLGVTP